MGLFHPTSETSFAFRQFATETLTTSHKDSEQQKGLIVMTRFTDPIQAEVSLGGDGTVFELYLAGEL